MATQKVLLAESDPAESKALSHGLRKRGYEVIGSNDAINTLAMARQSKPDVIVMSGALAGGGAETALKRIRSNVFTANIPVVALVGAKGANTGQLVKAGAQACLKRPATIEQVDQAIRGNVLESLDFTEAPRSAIADPDRMKALRKTKLLDSGAEESFDRLTRLVARLVGAPVALVTLVDKDRQFFKSQYGLKSPWAERRETNLSHSFCQWVVSGREPVVVNDANRHEVLRHNLAIKALDVTAYAGVPLYAPGGEALGSFCAIDSTPRAWSDDEVATLMDVGLVVEAYAVDSARASALAVRAVAGILERFGDRLTDEDRADLVAILREKSDSLTRFAKH